jgi:uncharacterized protein
MGADIFAHHAHILPSPINPNATVDRLLQLLDNTGISHAVCFAPFSHQVASLGLNHNPWLASELAGRTRLVGFGTIDFNLANMKDQVRQAVDLGLKGLKLHPNTQKFDILSPQALDLYAAAQEADLLVTFHTGVHHSRLKDCAITKFDEVAHQFPNLRFTMEHMGGSHFFNEALAVLLNNFPPPWEKGSCKIFAGLTSVFTQHQLRFWYLRPDQIMEIILQTSANQVIFGLDFPYNLERETNIALETIRGLNITEPEREKILGGNLRRELDLN